MASAPSVQEEPLQPGTKHFRNQLAATVRSIGWSYAIFWSIPTSRSGVLTWNDGFYNGDIKTRKITNSTDDLTADQLVLQRSEQLRELYNSLLSGECDHRARRPAAALSPEDLGDTEWYYVVCMTYTFRPGQGLPGKSFATNEFVWLCNARTADRKTFPRALLAKSASIQTIVCVPFMGGVLELGTTDSVSEDPNLVNRVAAHFWELQFPASTCLEEPSSSPSPTNETGDAADIMLAELVHSAVVEEEHELGADVVVVECVPKDDANLEQISMEIDELYGLCEELDVVRSLEDSGSWLVEPVAGSFQLVPASSPDQAAPAVAANDVDGVVSRTSCFVAWTRADSDEVAVLVAGGEYSQRLLKKTVDGGAWMSNGRGGSAARTEESSIKNHVISERRRREKLNDMFLILKSMLPSIHKVDKASILAETIDYIKELKKTVKELESSVDEPSRRRPIDTRGRRRHELAGRVSGAKRKPPSSEGGGDGDVERARRCVLLSQNGPSNVTVTVADKEVLLEVQCRWKELLMTRVFDAIKSLSLDVISVQASSPDGLLELKIRANKFASSGIVAPGMISEALRKAIGS